MDSLEFGSLKKCFLELLNKVALQKTKFLRASDFKFVTKEESTVIVLRTKLRNQFLKKTISRGIFVSVLWKDINSNKKSSATEALFSIKIKSEENIFLDESGKR